MCCYQILHQTVEILRKETNSIVSDNLSSVFYETESDRQTAEASQIQGR